MFYPSRCMSHLSLEQCSHGNVHRRNLAASCFAMKSKCVLQQRQCDASQISRMILDPAPPTLRWGRFWRAVILGGPSGIPFPPPKKKEQKRKKKKTPPKKKRERGRTRRTLCMAFARMALDCYSSDTSGCFRSRM